MSKITIYQVLPRLFGNKKTTNLFHGSINENGCGKFSDFSIKALEEIKLLGITHVWYTGIIEHATCTDYTNYRIQKDNPTLVKGNAGSAYAIKDYYDVDPDLATNVTSRMKEFENLVNRTHRVGLKVIIDFVPNHVAREYKSDMKPNGVKDLGEDDHPEWAFSPLNNFYYIPYKSFSPEFAIDNYFEDPAKATGNDVFHESPSVNDWYETIKLNYGVNYLEGMQMQFDPLPETWFKMRDILLYWSSKKIDGFRCDMAEMVPVEFWNWVIPQVKALYPHLIFIAEVYNPDLYRSYVNFGGFDYLYDKVGMYDTLRGIISKNHSASDITRAWQSVGDIQDKMLMFLENHDEQRIASGFFAGHGMYAKPAMIVAATLTKAPVMIYFGQELGENAMEAEGFSGLDGRTSIFDYWGLKSIQHWSNAGKFDGALLNQDQLELRMFYKRLFNIVLTEVAISEGEMYDLGYANLCNPAFDPHKQFVYLRKYSNHLLFIAVNFADKCVDIKVNIPSEAFAHLQLPDGLMYSGVDLLNTSVASENFLLSSAVPASISLNAWCGKIIKLNLL